MSESKQPGADSPQAKVTDDKVSSSDAASPAPVKPSLLPVTWKLLSNNWILLSVLIMENMVMLIAKGGQLGFGVNPTLEVALYFFHLAVLGGWLYQMKAVILRPTHRTNLDDFLNGVARYFNPLMTGGTVFLMICFFGLILSTMLATALAGEFNQTLVQKLAQLMQAEKLQEIEALMKQEKVAFEQLELWFISFLGGVLVLGLYCSTLSFWTHWSVLSDGKWSQAWKHSRQTIFKHWKPLILLGLLWAAPTLFLFLGLFSGLEAVAIVAMLLGLVIKTYFTLMFCQFLVQSEPQWVQALQDTPPSSQMK